MNKSYFFSAVRALITFVHIIIIHLLLNITNSSLREKAEMNCLSVAHRKIVDFKTDMDVIEKVKHFTLSSAV